MTSSAGSSGLLETLKRYWKRHEKARFLIVGAYNTAFGYGAFIAVYLLMGRPREVLPLMAAQLTAHLVSVCNAFLGHRCLVFQVKGQLFTDFVRFNLTYVGTILFGIAAMPMLVKGVGLHPILSQGILLTITVVMSYALHKRVSFRRNAPDPPDHR